MKRVILVAGGSLAVAVGVLGVFLPLLPSTPFFLLAAACFVRSSERLHAWILENRFTGPTIRNYQSGRGMPLRAKIWTIALLWATLSVSALLLEVIWVRWVLLGVAVGVPVIILLAVPTFRESPVEPVSEASRDLT